MYALLFSKYNIYCNLARVSVPVKWVGNQQIALFPII